MKPIFEIFWHSECKVETQSKLNIQNNFVHCEIHSVSSKFRLKDDNKEGRVSVQRSI